MTEEVEKSRVGNYDQTLSSHGSLQQTITELRVAKTKLLRQQGSPEDGIRDAATISIQEIYELSETLGLTVDKSVNDAYSSICSQTESKKTSSNARNSSTGRSGLYSRGSNGKSSEIRRNNFIVKRDSVSRTNTSGTIAASTKGAVKLLDIKDQKTDHDSERKEQENNQNKKKVKIIDTSNGELRQTSHNPGQEDVRGENKNEEKQAESHRTTQDPKSSEQSPQEREKIEKNIQKPKEPQAKPKTLNPIQEETSVKNTSQHEIDNKSSQEKDQKPVAPPKQEQENPPKKKEPEKPKPRDPLLEKEHLETCNPI